MMPGREVVKVGVMVGVVVGVVNGGWWKVVGVEVGVEGGAVVWFVGVILTVGVSLLFFLISTMIQAYTYACNFLIFFFFFDRPFVQV